MRVWVRNPNDPTFAVDGSNTPRRVVYGYPPERGSICIRLSSFRPQDKTQIERSIGVKYRGWGGSNEILGQKFDDWWKDHWKTLFAVQKEGDKPKFPLTTQKPKPDGYRTALLVYENRNAGSNWEIADKVQRIEERRRYGVQSFFYARDDVEEGREDKMIIQSRVGGY